MGLILSGRELRVTSQSQHLLHAPALAFLEHGLLLQAALSARVLTQEHVIVVRFPPGDLPAARYFEPFACRLVGFQL